MPDITLEQCKDLNNSLQTATFNASTLCTDALKDWSPSTFSQAEQVLFDGMSYDEYLKSLIPAHWGPARQDAFDAEQASFQNLLGSSTWPNQPACAQMLDSNSNGDKCMPADFNFEVSGKTQELLLVKTNNQLQQTSAVVATVDASLQNSLDRAKNIDEHLNAMKTNLTSLGGSLQTLGGMTGIYAALIDEMAEVNVCGAKLTQVYNDMLLETDKLDIDAAEAVLDECDGLLTADLQRDIGIGFSPHCTDDSGGRRRLDHSATAPVAPGFNYTYLECFEEHALVEPVYCGGSMDRCCPRGSNFGDTSCPSRSNHQHLGTAQTGLMMGDNVRAECMQFNTFVLSKALHSQILRLKANANVLESSLSTIERNAYFARVAVEQCADDAGGIADAYMVNAQALVMVYHCQKLITEELKRIAEECLDARMMILIPYYGLWKYRDHACLTMDYILMGAASTGVTTLVILKLLHCCLCASAAGAGVAHAVHRHRHKRENKKHRYRSSSSSSSDNEAVAPHKAETPPDTPPPSQTKLHTHKHKHRKSHHGHRHERP